MILRLWMIEPGHPCVTMSGNRHSPEDYPTKSNVFMVRELNCIKSLFSSRLIASGAENPRDIDSFNDSCIFELKAQLHLSIFTGQPMVKLALSVVPSNVL
jgi:hypothetical protein